MRAVGALAGFGGRRGLTVVVLLCAAAAVLVLVAAGRTWLVEVSPRPAPLPELVTVHTGGTLRPWLPALGWVALAGAGALLATRGIGRRAVGGMLLLAGAGIAAGALTAGAGGWPVLAAAGGMAVAAAGALATAYGGRWPAMGARYERARPREGGRSATAGEGNGEAIGGVRGTDGGTGTHGTNSRAGTDDPDGADDGAGDGAGAGGTDGRAGADGGSRVRPGQWWDALDRGEDPTS